MAAGIAAGLRWGWPALLLVLKPIFLPLAALGAGRVSWWVGAGMIVLVSLAMLPLWSQYIVAMRSLRIGLDYSLGSLPLLLVPITAWLGRDRTRDPVPPTAERCPTPVSRISRDREREDRHRAGDPEPAIDRQERGDLRRRRRGRQEVRGEHDRRTRSPARARSGPGPAASGRPSTPNAYRSCIEVRNENAISVVAARPEDQRARLRVAQDRQGDDQGKDGRDGIADQAQRSPARGRRRRRPRTIRRPRRSGPATTCSRRGARGC